MRHRKIIDRVDGRLRVRLPRGFMVLAACLLWSCSKGPSAQKQYEVMSGAGASSAELCAQSGKVTQAYLEDGNTEKYKYWRKYASEQCAVARLLRGTGYDDPS